VVVATAIMTVVSTRMALAVHQDVVELLHMMGARDSFIGVLFQVQALKVGLIGGIAGAALAAGTLFGLEQAAKHLDAAVLIDLRPAASDYVAVVALAVVTALIAMVTARFAALRALRRLT
jgi:cell division transport system permease protein